MQLELVVVLLLATKVNMQLLLGILRDKVIREQELLLLDMLIQTG